MNKLYLATRIVIFAVEIAAIAAAVNGIVNANSISLFAGILLYIGMRAIDEKQRDDKIKEELTNKLTGVSSPEDGDENLWMLFQVLLVLAMILLATL